MKTALAIAVVVTWASIAGGSPAADPTGFLIGSAAPRSLVLGATEGATLLAQRSIEREWTGRGDPGAESRPGAPSALGAMALSAAIPGAGQVYSGRGQGLYYAAAELMGWIGWTLLRRDANRLRDDATTLAGAPDDSTSAWSFDRYQGATGEDASFARALYAADHEDFYQAIDSDPRYAAGWDAAAVRSRFGDLRQRSDQRLEAARWTSAGLWVNHLVAAVGALQAVRLRNLDMDLAGHVRLKARGGWHGGRAGVLLTLERRF